MTSGSHQHLIIHGAGGHGREILWLAREVLPGVDVEFSVDDGMRETPSVNGVAVRELGELDDLSGTDFVVAIGSADVRRRAAAELMARGSAPIALVHPRAEIAPTASIGAGSVVCAGSVISDRVVIGAHVVVNVGSTVSHDCVIHDYSTLSPGVRVAGNVVIEGAATIGVGAVVINGTEARPLRIGAGAMVGAGAVVIRSVADGATVVGNPARALTSPDSQ